MYLSTSTSTEDFPEMYLSTFQVLCKLYLSTDVLKYKVLLPGSDLHQISLLSYGTIVFGRTERTGHLLHLRVYYGMRCGIPSLLLLVYFIIMSPGGSPSPFSTSIVIFSYVFFYLTRAEVCQCHSYLRQGTPPIALFVKFLHFYNF